MTLPEKKAKSETLTPIRKQVLDLIAQQNHPVTAYELLNLMRKKRSAEPPTIYRALDYLQTQGFIHRIHSDNRYVACQHPVANSPPHSQILVCKKCGSVQEVIDVQLNRKIKKIIHEYDFLLDNDLIEILGLCVACQSNG